MPAVLSTPLRFGKDYHKDLACAYLAHMPADKRSDLKYFSIGKPSIVWSSGCSGSESPRLAVEGTAHACVTEFGNFPARRHLIAAEIDVEKRGFINLTSDVEQLLGDLHDISCRRAYCHKAHGYIVPDEFGESELWLIGFSCKTVSAYNINKSQIRQAHLDLSTQTGSTLHGIYVLVEQKRPRVLVLENVKNVILILEPFLNEFRNRGYFCSTILKLNCLIVNVLRCYLCFSMQVPIYC